MNIYKYTFEFSKTGPLCFVGHLDLMQAFRKAIKRAKLPVRYSSGYNPHMEFSIALPLPVGFEALAELADLELSEELSENDFFCQLSSQLPPGLTLNSVNKNPINCKTAAARLQKATYSVVVSYQDHNALSAKIDELLKLSEIVVFKPTKNGGKYEDIKSDIYSILSTPIDNNTANITMTVSCGSERNLKPDTVLAAIFGEDSPKYTITRTKLHLRE